MLLKGMRGLCSFQVFALCLVEGLMPVMPVNLPDWHLNYHVTLTSFPLERGSTPCCYSATQKTLKIPDPAEPERLRYPLLLGVHALGDSPQETCKPTCGKEQQQNTGAAWYYDHDIPGPWCVAVDDTTHTTTTADDIHPALP